MFYKTINRYAYSLLPSRSHHQSIGCARFNTSGTRLLCHPLTRPPFHSAVYILPNGQQQQQPDLKKILLMAPAAIKMCWGTRSFASPVSTTNWPFQHKMTTNCSFGRCPVKLIIETKRLANLSKFSEDMARKSTVFATTRNSLLSFLAPTMESSSCGLR